MLVLLSLLQSSSPCRPSWSLALPSLSSPSLSSTSLSLRRKNKNKSTNFLSAGVTQVGIQCASRGQCTVALVLTLFMFYVKAPPAAKWVSEAMFCYDQSTKIFFKMLTCPPGPELHENVNSTKALGMESDLKRVSHKLMSVSTLIWWSLVIVVLTVLKVRQ